MELIYTDGEDKRFSALCGELDDYLNEIVGGKKQREKYDQFNTRIDIHDVVLIIENGEAVGCGAFKRYDGYTAEIKRVFIKNEYRGKGYAKLLMQALEEKALAEGYLKAILETGNLLKPAMALYRDIGYEVIDNYGQYANMPESVCMAKKLVI